MNIALEALKLHRERQVMDVQKIMGYAKTCRVSNVIKPYIEALL